MMDLGEIDSRYWPDRRNRAITQTDNYAQWKQAIRAEEGTAANRIQRPAGFSVERLRSARSDEGSWISMAFAPNGKLILSREDQGLLQIDPRDPETVTPVESTLKECRGLLFAPDGTLYANANNSKGLFRLRDTNGDGRFDQRELLLSTTGGVGHGRNDLAWGPDGFLYSIHGDAVDIPTNSNTQPVRDLTSPLRAQRHGGPSREGHVVRIDPQTGDCTVVCAGLRNPYGIAFHADGEPFTYDADAEYDMGSPWYRPTRIVQLLAGAFKNKRAAGCQRTQD